MNRPSPKYIWFSDSKNIRALSWIFHGIMHFWETWLKLFGLLLVAMGFSIFIFSVGIKLFYRHPLVLFGIWILLEQFDDFVQLPPRCILKDIQLCLYKYLKRWVLYPIIAYAKQIKIQDVALTRIRLLLKMEAVVK